MQKFYILIVSLFLLMGGVAAQQMPQGMQYQAVARDLKGNVLPDQDIQLKINLVSDEKSRAVYYSEVHTVKTNNLGLFTLVIGGGKSENGKFADIPWSSQDIWMQIAIKDKGKSDFAMISNSRLLAVPYAFHAATASQLVSQQKGDIVVSGNEPGVPSQNWSLFGNSNSDASKDKLGTTDYVDLVFVTNNLERLRILANGDINLKRSLTVGANLNVDSSVYLNRVSGKTINYGPFTVERQSPTLLTGSLTVAANQPTLLGGTLTVDKATDLNSSLNVDGKTDLNSNLTVNNGSPTKLTGSLQVDGVTNLNNSLNVLNASPTVLTGTLLTNQNATFNEKVLLTNNTHNSTSTTNGALVVAGGVGIGRNLNVGGDANFGGKTSFAGSVDITDQTESVSTTTGALKVAGGVGIVKRLNVGGATQINNIFGATGAATLGSTLGVTGATTLSSTLGVTGATTLSSTLGVTGATTLSSTLGVNGIATINNTTESSSSADGALNVLGGIGVAKNLNVGGSLTTTGPTTFSNTLSVTGAGSLPGGYIAQFSNTNNSNGISIKVGASTPANANNFVTFLNSAGNTVGRIEGETQAELENNEDYKAAIRAYDFDIATSSVDLSIATFEIAQAVVEVAAAASSSTACAGLGLCITAPIPSFIVSAGTNLVLKIANEVSEATSLAGFVTNKQQFVDSKAAQIGVTYQSGAGDYAEWLPKLNMSQKFLPGQIVGIKDGHISLNTDGASQLLVISSKPIVLGNMPVDGEESNYEKVAFMGQVPVHVLGKVNRGDYILPAGKNNGLGIAVSPANMKLEDYNKIVGIAWTSSTNNSYSLINVAIGLNTNDVARVVVEQNEKIKNQASEIKDLKNQMNENNAVLAKLIPGFKEARGITIGAEAITANTNEHKDAHVVAPVAGDIVYFDVTNDQIEAMIDMAEKVFVEGGGKYQDQPFWNRLHSDRAFKENLKQQMSAKFKNAIHSHKEVNKAHLIK